jgi:hypothetical protein
LAQRKEAKDSILPSFLGARKEAKETSAVNYLL